METRPPMHGSKRLMVLSLMLSDRSFVRYETSRGSDVSLFLLRSKRVRFGVSGTCFTGNDSSVQLDRSSAPVWRAVAQFCR